MFCFSAVIRDNKSISSKSQCVSYNNKYLSGAATHSTSSPVSHGDGDGGGAAQRVHQQLLHHGGAQVSSLTE